MLNLLIMDLRFKLKKKTLKEHLQHSAEWLESVSWCTEVLWQDFLWGTEISILICVSQWSCFPAQAVWRNIWNSVWPSLPPQSKCLFCCSDGNISLVKQIFRAERNIWAARMCQNRTDVCLLKTHWEKSYLVLDCCGCSHNGLISKELETWVSF